MQSKNCPMKFNTSMEWYNHLENHSIEAPEPLICDEKDCAWWCESRMEDGKPDWTCAIKLLAMRDY